MVKQILISGITPFVIRKFRPKVLFGITQFLQASSMIAFAIFNHLTEHPQDLKSSLDKVSWIPLAVIVITIWTRNAGILPILHNLIAELYPTDIRTQSIGITQAIFLIGGATCLKFFPNMKNTIG